ncbi:MAG: magnesium transporter CorA family protein [Beijerinckiaceae bacterium]|jgi:magnesium transporter|nr:magnesium transporter CorA family protein [Beijerinckiaceae bacterium]
MIIAHVPSANGAGLERLVLSDGMPVPAQSLWIDLMEPTREEDRLVEEHLQISIPTREEMLDLEPSEIIYTEDDARYMTARILCHSDTDQPRLVAVSFILTAQALVTVRYDEPRSFALFTQRACKPSGCGHQPEAVLDGLIEAVIDRAAEILGRVGDQIEDLSRSVFERDSGRLERSGGYQGVIRKLGRQAGLISNVRESMVSLERMLIFLQANSVRPTKRSGFQAEWRTAIRDVQSIEDHAGFINNKVQFILNATLGLVSLEQNKIIKIFSVAAVIFLPPTLIASSYGMNFKNMPELDWLYGYPVALGLMVASAVGTYTFFKLKRWL